LAGRDGGEGVLNWCYDTLTPTLSSPSRGSSKPEAVKGEGRMDQYHCLFFGGLKKKSPLLPKKGKTWYIGATRKDKMERKNT